MALPTKCDIAIIGAAPVGLFLANQPASPSTGLCC
jgi:hypothetical protein